jgi:integrase
VKNEWLYKDPFVKYKASYKDTYRESLNEEELRLLENITLPNQTLNTVRDIFIFSCYTGLAHYDVKQLSQDNIQIGIDGERWIKIKRQKTGNECNIPLLPKAIAILKKYENHPVSLNRNVLLPVFSNQKTNKFLKQIAHLCGFKINLTFHKSRHTFSMVALNNGVPIESLSAMLAHKSLRTTQIYAHAKTHKISEDMKRFQKVLESKNSLFINNLNNHNYDLHKIV